MTLGLHESRLRQRRRRRLAILKWVLVFAALFFAGYYAYETGSALAQQEVRDLRQEIESLRQTVAELTNAREDLAQQVEAARVREEQWEERYRRDVPTGESKELFALVQDRLSNGVPADRLEFVIGATSTTASCDGRPDTKRFIVPTPIYQGANDSIGFANSTIRVTAMGESATDSRGNLEAWFDPAKPVTVSFTSLGGKKSEVSGVLPLHHSVVKGENEYRFTIVAGNRGFVNVTGDRCDYP